MLLKKDPEYRKLKIGGRGLFSRVSYWLAKDHLLLVEIGSYAERYRRYRLDEIKAVYANRNARRLGLNLVFGILFGLLGILPLAASSGNPIALAFGVAFSTMFGVALIVNSLRGPTCITRVITDVQSTRLKGVNRLNKVDRLIVALREATQHLGRETTAEKTVSPESKDERVVATGEPESDTQG